MPGRSHGEQRRQRILGAATDLASAEGLDRLSIARLASETGMSKSGVFAHFGSKQRLQAASIEAAAREFEVAVLERTADAEPGLDRLRALIEAWIQHVEDTPRRGGCFFFATSSEFSSRPGPLRDQLADKTGAWLRQLEREARTAVRTREIAADPELLVFRLHAYVQEANWMRQLFDRQAAFGHARRAVAATLDEAITHGAPSEEPT